MRPTDESRSPSQLERAALVLAAFEGSPSTLTLTDVVRRTRLAQTTVHRLMDQLVTLGWLEREGRRYRLGLRLVELGAFALHRNRLRAAALPHLISLHQATGHWAHLSIMDNAEVVYLEQIGDPRKSMIPIRVGTRLPPHCTAAGKILLAFAGGPMSRKPSTALVPRTRRTITGAETLRSELEAVRKQGTALDRGESFPEVQCAAAPLRGGGHAVAAISLSWTGTHVDAGQMTKHVDRCAHAVWGSLLGSIRTLDRQAPRSATSDESSAVLAWLRFSEWSD